MSGVGYVKTVLRLGGALGAASREMFKSLEHGLFSLDSLHEDLMYASMVRIMTPQLESMVLYPQVCRKINYRHLPSLRLLLVSCDIHWKHLNRILPSVERSL